MKIARYAAACMAVIGMAQHMAWAEPVISATNVPVETGARRETVVEGLEHPWAIAFLPDGGMLVTERPGRLRLIWDGKLFAEPIAGVPSVFAQNQGGLLDVALHPDFAKNQFVYLTLSAGTADANQTTLVRGRLGGQGPSRQLEDVKTLFQVSQAKRGAQHFGSRLAWLPDKTLLMSIGDGGNPPNAIDGRLTRDFAQDKASHLGKILRLAEDGAPAADNPFRNDSGAKPEVFTLGHRNIQGLVSDPTRQTIWATEHGSLGGDELNRIEKGKNYGWPVVARTRDYRTGQPVAPVTSRADVVDPVLLWDVATAPSGLMLYDGQAFPQWRGDLFSGSLISQDIRRIDLDPSGKVLGETALRIGQRVRDVRQGPDGLVYVLTDERAGRVFRFRPDANAPTAPVATPSR